ncbi:MAG: DsbA family protein [Prevotellaceae bacterium]|jgi:hypothetical protein|nr:DsbA family protein [Prevotellaceae bacterium]
MSYEGWKKRFSVTDNEYGKTVLPEQLKWSAKANIAYTPTTFRNGRRVPTSLRFNDLRHWLSEMTEQL